MDSTVSMPSWLALVNDGNGSATLSGLASVADEGSYNLKFKVVDTVDPSLSSVQQFTFT